jgi:putative spermidine/putrescine transport system substrate-binding protein
MSMHSTRRSLLLAAASLPLATARPALAAVGGRVVVATWGGDYGDLLGKHVEQPLLKPLGIEAVQSVDDGPPRKAKLLAERNGRRGSLDVVSMVDFEASGLAQLGLFETLTEANVPNARNAIAALRQPQALPHIYSGLVIAYNPAKIKAAPKSLADLWDPKYKGRVGFADILFPYNIAAASLAAGGTLGDLAPGMAKLGEMKALAPKIFATNEAVAQALKAEDIWITLAWRARVHQWRRAGVSVAAAVPAEGIVPTTFTASVPRNSQQKDNAFAYLNAMLDAGAQSAFAERMGYVPTVTNAKLPPELAAQIAFTPEEQSRFKVPDFGYFAQAMPALQQYWSRDFKAA